MNWRNWYEYRLTASFPEIRKCKYGYFPEKSIFCETIFRSLSSQNLKNVTNKIYQANSILLFDVSRHLREWCRGWEGVGEQEGQCGWVYNWEWQYYGSSSTHTHLTLSRNPNQCNRLRPMKTYQVCGWQTRLIREGPTFYNRNQC